MNSTSLKNKARNILIFPGGTEIGLEIYRSLKHIKNIKLFSASDNFPNHSTYAFKHHFTVPKFSDSNWLKSLNEIISSNNIEYIFPGNDIALDALVNNQDSINAQVVSSPKDTCELMRSKRDTYRKFSDSLPVPHVFESPQDVTKFPVFVKPDKGYGSQGALKIENQKALESALSENPELLISEYLEGPEYSVDCFTDKNKGLLFCSGRDRRRIRMGTSVRSGIVSNELNDVFYKYATIISDALDIRGAWFFQMKENKNGDLVLLEIGPRIAGTMALHRAKGVNFPLLSIYEREGINIDIMTNEFNGIEIDRVLLNRFNLNNIIDYNTVYVDLDDTIIVNKKLNLNMIRFLYQCVNRDCQIILISKCLTDINEVLTKWKIKEIFDEIIWLKEEESKADHIKPDKAIFIDDSFSQRKEVSDRLGIDTFDSSMIEALIDVRL